MYLFPGSLQAVSPGNKITGFGFLASVNICCSSSTVVDMVSVSLGRLFPMTAMDSTFFILPFFGSDPMQQPAVHITFGILMLLSLGLLFVVEVYVIFSLGREFS